MGLKLLRLKYMYFHWILVLFYISEVSECHNLKLITSLNKQPGQFSKWYLKWLTIRNGNLQKGGLQSRETNNKLVDIQADEPGCRDDLCIEDDLDPDYFDERNAVEVSTLDVREIACPHGYEAIVRDGVIYCDVVRESTTDGNFQKQCEDNEERVGTDCRPVTNISPVARTVGKEDHGGNGCLPGQIMVMGENGIRCIEEQIQIASSSPAVDSHTESPTKEVMTQKDINPISTTQETQTTQLESDSRPDIVTHTQSTDHREGTKIHHGKTSLISLLRCPEDEELVLTNAGPLCQGKVKQTAGVTQGDTRCSDGGENCPSIQTSQHRQATTETLKEHVYTNLETITLISQRKFDNDQLLDENIKNTGVEPEIHLKPFVSTSLPKSGSDNEHGKYSNQGISNRNRINSHKGQQSKHPSKTNFVKPFINHKLAPCEDGKVLAGTQEGYKCVDPVFPVDVCPPGRVPHLSSTGLQCVPCPFGQYTQMVDGGIRCVVITSLSPTIDSSTMPCPEGMTPFLSPTGRICIHTPLTTKTMKQQYCPDGQTVTVVGNKFECKTREIVCPAGRVPITLETGKTICAFDLVEQKKDSDEDRLSNICPPGLEAVHLPSGEVSCQYITEITTLPIQQTTSWCGLQEVLTHNPKGFLCQSVGSIPEKALPDCADNLILVRFGQFYDCITESEAKLQCTDNEQLMREENGFVCKRVWDDASVQSPCGSDEVLNTDESGHVSCISMIEAEEQCGIGFIAVKYGDGYICRKRTPEVRCPDGFKIQLVKGTPTCVSISGPDCIEEDGTVSELCRTDLHTQQLPDLDLDPDFIFESDSSCIEGQKVTIIDGNQVCVDEGNKEATDHRPCESDGIRPCDLDLAILLQGCNPECANGGTCKDGKCLCREGITGVACSKDIDECTSLQNIDCDYMCENTFGSYQCTCPNGMILSTNGRNCEDPGCIPECLNGGECVGGRCQCQQGFEGEDCQTDKDECSLYGERLCQHYCRNTYGGYECICPPGSRLNPDKRTCTNTTCIPECRNGGSCENHICYCPSGYYGFVCQLDVNECYRDSPCDHDCINTWGSFRCTCKDGYRLQLDGHSCLSTFID